MKTFVNLSVLIVYGLLPAVLTIKVYEDVNENYTTTNIPSVRQQYSTLAIPVDEVISTTPMSTQNPIIVTTMVGATNEKSKAELLDEMRKSKIANFKASMQYPKVFNKNAQFDYQKNYSDKQVVQLEKQQQKQESLQSGKVNSGKSTHVDAKPKVAFVSSADRVAYKNRQLYTASNTQRVQSTATAADSTLAKSVKDQFVASPQLIDNDEMKAKGADHFFPTGDNYYKPMKQDAQFPNYGSSGGGDMWTGSAQSPFSSDGQRERKPLVVHGQWRHQYVTKEDPTYKWYPQNEHYYHHHYGNSHNYGHGSVQAPPEPARDVTGRGKWHWIPDDEDNHEDVKPTNHLPTISPTIYEEVKIDDYRPATESSPIGRDHPYSYETSPTYTPDLGHTSVSSVGFGAASEVPFTLDYKSKDSYKGPVVTSKQRPVSPWAKIVRVLTAAIPIGLIISALTPHVVYVNPNATQPLMPHNPPLTSFLGTTSNFQPHRQRSLHDTILTMLTNNGLTQLARTPSCEDRIFCELSVMGGRAGAEQLYTMLWKIANDTPDDHAHHAGLHDVFKAVKTNNCAQFQCENITEILKTAQSKPEHRI